MKRSAIVPLDKIYDSAQIEEKWVRIWGAEGAFAPDISSDRPSFSMVIPPPNVTGVLHLGHALNTTLQDILARYKRMKGFNVLWIPGTDHAGIATQNVVERQLTKEGTSRHHIGRDAFIDRVWKWKQSSGGTIIGQLKKLGASCDWDREKFTLDPVLSKAVREAFVKLYHEGLIYRAERLINWCPACQTALSDIEVEHEETQGKLYHIKYPIAGETDCLTVATTRPETLLGDTAVAVHPEDPRFNRLIGKFVQLPLTTRTIPIVGDPILVDRTFGTGAVKITPGHDFNDEKAGKRHQLATISLLDQRGSFSPPALIKADAIASLITQLGNVSVLEGRKQVISALEERGLLVDVKDHLMAVGKCYRCKSVIEPSCSLQWFVNVNDKENSLAGPAILAVREKKIRLIPESWEPNYFGWMENIEDWCISRQIWWGHQIPAWYCVGNDISQCGLNCGPVLSLLGKPIVSATPPQQCPQCGSKALQQDSDVLDTWFSSALWPFSTLGWPDKDSLLLKKFYPTTTLISGFDILFFWVARMIMMGLHFTKAVPFRNVYIHALVRDAQGHKMSKSKGNVIDPIVLMNKYGTDALRFTLASMASPGRDIKLSEERIEGYRNFTNKIWNAARFILMYLPEERGSLRTTPTPLTPPDVWIKIRLYQTIAAVDSAMERYRFDEAAEIAYQFVWHQFCDWYLELSKVVLQNDGGKENTIETIKSVFHDILCLLHPFMPFITQELLPNFIFDNKTPEKIAFPKIDEGFLNHPENIAMARLVDERIIETVTKIRNVRGEMNISSSEEMSLLIDAPNNNLALSGHVAPFLPYIKRLARIGEITVGENPVPPKRAAVVSISWGTIYILLNTSHIQKEIDRVEKNLQKIKREMLSLETRLATPDFTRAPQAVQNQTRLQLEAAVQKNRETEKQRCTLRELI